MMSPKLSISKVSSSISQVKKHMRYKQQAVQGAAQKRKQEITQRKERLENSRGSAVNGEEKSD